LGMMCSEMLSATGRSKYYTFIVSLCHVVPRCATLSVALTVLFAVLLAHGAVCTGASGNPAVTVTRLLLDDGTAAAAALGVAGQILGAHLGLVVARRYWALEMTDLHVIKALMGAECSTALRSSPAQGFCVEAACGATFTLLHLGLRRKPALLRVPALAATLTFLSHAGRNYTSGVANPALAYALTFRCSGFSFTQYALVYWLGTLAGTFNGVLHLEPPAGSR
uniref:Aquaporin n=1 Tax=Denticeps clupeoides TaxID=299321 RepID=A0AAY4C1M4_9TELE